jgi:hypothetical protein
MTKTFQFSFGMSSGSTKGLGLPAIVALHQEITPQFSITWKAETRYMDAGE